MAAHEKRISLRQLINDFCRDYGNGDEGKEKGLHLLVTWPVLRAEKRGIPKCLPLPGPS